jgi:hypothetical protein
MLLLEKRNKTIKGMKNKRLKEVPSINFERHSVTSWWKALCQISFYNYPKLNEVLVLYVCLFCLSHQDLPTMVPLSCTLYHWKALDECT